MTHLNIGDILYRIVYYPEIYLEIYYIKKIYKSHCDNTSRVTVRPYIGDGDISFWIETTVNLNKLIKYKPFPNYLRTKGYFFTTNEELAIRKLKILLQYAPKTKQ